MAEYKRIGDLRVDHDLTVRDLAEKIGINYVQYWRYEKGYRDIPTDILIRLADLYGVSIDYILGQTDSPERNQ